MRETDIKPKNHVSKYIIAKCDESYQEKVKGVLRDDMGIRWGVAES